MNPENHRPTIHWRQTNNAIYLKINIDNPKDIKVQFDDNLAVLSIKNNDKSEDPEKVILFLEFFGATVPKENRYNVIDEQLKIELKKAADSMWTQLLSGASDPLWVFNDDGKSQTENMKEKSFKNPGRGINVHKEELEARDIHHDYPRMYDELHREELGYRKEDLKKVYLVFYNLCQYIGFMYVLIIITIRYSREGPASMKDTYENVGNVMKFIQLMQFLEVMHPAFGYTQGNCFIAFVQVGGRAFILFCMIEAETRMQTKPLVFYIFFIWSLIEIFRYPYYITQLLNVSIPLLTWLRYTIWIPLYPLGFLCEGIIVLRNIPYFEETKKFTISLPNSWNFSFHLPSVLRIYLLLLCLPGMYTMMSHMSKVRRRKLAKSKAH